MFCRIGFRIEWRNKPYITISKRRDLGRIPSSKLTPTLAIWYDMRTVVPIYWQERMRLYLTDVKLRIILRCDEHACVHVQEESRNETIWRTAPVLTQTLRNPELLS
jgi:hypothetical protein